MLKLKNETKIGILAVIAIGLAIWGFQFLKGINMLSRSQTFYVRYANVDQLRPSSPIFISGLQVGTVKDLYVDPEDDKTIIAVLNIEADLNIPKDTRATIIGLTLMGGKAVELVIPAPCSGDDCAESGDFLQGASKGFLETVVGDPHQIDAYTERLRYGLTTLYDSIADPNDPHGIGRTLVSLETSLVNLAAMTGKINRLLDASAGSITATTHNAADITKALSESREEMQKTLANLAAISEQLKNADLGQSAGRATAAIDSVAVAVSDLRRTLGTTQQTLSKVDTLAGRLVDGEGSAGKLLSDEALYDNLVRTSHHLHLLLQDLRLNPTRYNTVKVKMFGKTKKPYETPLNDPAYQLLIDSLERDYDNKLRD
jgi:phospholipid/cholesterol/gamma-HCH transport system substrate-binding protein